MPPPDIEIVTSVSTETDDVKRINGSAPNVPAPPLWRSRDAASHSRLLLSRDRPSVRRGGQAPLRVDLTPVARCGGSSPERVPSAPCNVHTAGR